MKKFFYFGILGLLLFEIANVYFIMPMPGSQQSNSIGTAYFLYSWRWVFRGLFGLMIILGFAKAFRGSKVLALVCLLLASAIAYAANFKMAADSMFRQPVSVNTVDALTNKVDSGKLVIGVVVNGQAKAYPIQFLGYHHQVFDTVGNKPVIVTYCTVCRTGRVFEPIVDGKRESFRLVGMDHFNAMFEDKSTGSWWRQATGEAIAGELKGQALPEVASTQMTLGKWLSIYPGSLVMQADTTFEKEYESMKNYEGGKSKSGLTKRDSLSWQDKSWVVGVVVGKESKAYDWNALQKERILHDVLNGQPVAVVLASDNQSFAALQRISEAQKLSWVNDSLSDGQNKYNLLGASLSPNIPGLKQVNAYQEYWHSWRTFHPGTKK